jgi:uncharacterized damage-inducible protein DinB
MATAEQGLTTDFATAYREMMLQGFAGEVKTTKRVLAAIPEDKRDYRHDPNGRTAWELAWHLANTDVQFLDGIADGQFSMEGRPESEKPKTVAELVDWYDQQIARATARVRAMTPDQLTQPIEFFGVFNFPAAFYLGFLNNHSIHHRGALATYLRPMGAKCPSIYGGSYDEPFQGAQASNAA